MSTDIAVPKLNNNDESYILVDWLFADGEFVPDGEYVATVETSKAAEDLTCSGGGILHQVLGTAQECRPGEIIGRLFASEQERTEYLAGSAATPAAAEVAPQSPLVLTDAARALAEQHGIDEARLRALGKAVLKKSDVDALVAELTVVPKDSAEPSATPLDRAQQAIAAVVTESHRTIPAAFTLYQADVDAALDFAREEAERSGLPVGLPELLIKAVAGLHAAFPVFFAGYGADGLVFADTPRIGVTVDVGKGLYIPVVADPAGTAIGDLADLLMDYRIKAMRGDFRTQDLAGATIVVSLNNDDGVVFARPIIFPGQVAMISLGGTSTELELTADGSVRARRVAHIGISYDHRVINGREAAGFLKRLATVLAEPAALAGAGGAA